MRLLIIFSVIALLSFGIDQGSKYYVTKILDLENIGFFDVLPPLLTFKMGWNYGINFGLFANGHDFFRYFLILIAVGATIWVALWIFQKKTAFAALCAGFLAGGALANAYDRLIHGAVADFISITCCSINNPFVFNLADVFIFIGLIGIIYIMEVKKE